MSEPKLETLLRRVEQVQGEIPYLEVLDIHAYRCVSQQHAEELNCIAQQIPADLSRRLRIIEQWLVEDV